MSNQEFTFRSHVINGETRYYPRITHLLSKVIDKGEGFNQWLKSYGSRCDDIAQQASNKGSLVHKACASLLEKGEIYSSAYDLEESSFKMITGFKNFLKDSGAKPFKSEVEVCDGQCSGRYDLLLKLPDNKYMLTDIKTGTSIYNTHYLQIMFYLKCVKVMHPDFEIIPTILHLKDNTKKGYQCVEFTPEEITSYTKGYELTYELYKILGYSLEPKKSYELPSKIKLED